MAAIERSITMVENGNSTGSAARPKAPPTVPESVATALWAARWSVDPRGFSVRRAVLKAMRIALSPARSTIFEIFGGTIRPTRSISWPSAFASRVAKLLCSS